MAQDIFSLTKAVAAVTPRRLTDDTVVTGATIDRSGFDSLEFVIATGTLADAGASFAVTVEHDNDSAMGIASNPAASELVGTPAGASFTEASDGVIRRIGYIGDKRYVRIKITPTGNASSADVAAVAILGHPRLLPQTSQS